MRRSSAYRFLTFFCLGAAATALALAGVGLGLAHAFEAGAAALCSAVFFIPGLLFLRHWRRLAARDLALVHVAGLAEQAGVTDAKALAEKLDIPEADAAKIVRIAIREGLLQGEVDDAGRFVAASTPRCPACGAAVARSFGAAPCPSCGRPIPGGG